MAKISADSLLGNLQSQSTKTLGLLKQVDLKSDNNIRRASLLNTSLDAEEEDFEVSSETSKELFDFMIPKESMKSEEEQKEKFSGILSKQDYNQMRVTDAALQGGTEAGGDSGGDSGGAGAAAGALGLGLGAGAISNMMGGGETSGAGTPGTGSIDYVAPGKVSPVISGRYGEQRKTGSHGGTDLAGIAEGTPLRAISDGKIVDGGVDPGGWGNFIVFLDNKGIYHLYGHIQNGYRGKGDVKKGDIIAKVGMTGRTSGPHLHWESGTGWTGGVLTGKFDPLNRYSMHAPFSTARESTAKPAPSTTPSATSALQPAPRQSSTSAGSSGGQGGQSQQQRVSSNRPSTYNNGMSRSGAATYQQGLS